MKNKRIIRIIVALLMLIPFTVVNAATKTEEMIESLKEVVKPYNGTVNYEYDTIEIDWTVPNSKSNVISFPHKDNVIEYNPGEITSYKEAEDATSHTVYAIYLITSALRVNGYSDEEIEAFFNDENNEFNYDRNGIELKELGEPQKFTSEDGSMTMTITPISIKIDVTKANLTKEGDESFTEKSTTIDDIIDDLQSDSEFTTTEYEGKTVSENEISNDGDNITIFNIYYFDDYYNVSFQCEDDIITYEDAEIESYEEAERASSHHMFLDLILSNALKMNGYTNEQIQEFFTTEGNELNYDINGIEIKDIGEEKEFTSSDGLSKVSFSPLSMKIDLTKANLNKINETESNYKVLEGANQVISDSKELTFKFNIEYSKFLEDGKVYIDGELVDSSNYISKEGSTIITFNSDYVKTLSEKEHTLKVIVENKEVETKFTIEKKVNNPQTGDNIVFYILILSLSIFGLIGSIVYTKKNLINN